MTDRGIFISISNAATQDCTVKIKTDNFRKKKYLDNKTIPFHDSILNGNELHLTAGLYEVALVRRRCWTLSMLPACRSPGITD